MDSTQKTIFLVDDDLTNLELGSAALNDLYNVVTLSSGSLLLKTLERKIPALILLDIDMPGMNGYETLMQIKNREMFANIPVIFLTAKNCCDNEVEGLSLGAIDYITKPFSPPLLCKRIEMHLLLESQKQLLIEQKQELIMQQQKLLDFNNNLQEMVKEKTKTVVELQNAVLRTMADLVEFRDNTTGYHIEKTQHYLRILIEALIKSGLYQNEVSSWDVDLILQSSQLHDVGKIAIEDSILRKPSKLTPDEFAKIKIHTIFGEAIIERIKQNTTQQEFLEQAQILASSHHEKWDGSGYPYGLKGESIPLQGRLMAIADVYDALVSERPYKKAFTHEEAVDIIRTSSKTHFDPALVELFLGVCDEFKKISDEYKTRTM